MLGVTRERIRQIEMGAFVKLRESAAALGLDFSAVVASLTDGSDPVPVYSTPYLAPLSIPTNGSNGAGRPSGIYPIPVERQRAKQRIKRRTRKKRPVIRIAFFFMS